MNIRIILTAAVCLASLCVPVRAQPDLLPLLLEVPAPPAPNRFFHAGRGSDTPNFFSYKNPPHEDAPIDEILTYWKYWNRITPGEAFTVIPSIKVAERLFAEIEDNPFLIQDYVNVLSHFRDSGQRINAIFENDRNRDNFSIWNADEIKEWLRLNSNREIEDISEKAKKVTDKRNGIAHQEELLALARIDWEQARPVALKLSGNSKQPKSQIFANSILYKYSIKNGDTRVSDEQRKILMDVVEDPNSEPFLRNLALETIASASDFVGRDEWYFSLLEDESLSNLESADAAFAGLASFVKHTAPDKYLTDMIKLSRVKNQAVRNAAVRNIFEVLDLLDEGDLRGLIALLPWLSDKNWVTIDERFRQKLVSNLQTNRIEKSVPGLLSILNEMTNEVNRIEVAEFGSSEREIDRIRRISGRRRNAAYATRLEVVKALGHQRDALAVVPLKRLIPAHRQYDRVYIVKAIHACHGYEGRYQVQALEYEARENIEAAQRRDIKEQEIVAELLATSRFPELSDEISPGTNPSFVSKSWGTGIGFGYSIGSRNGGFGSDYFIEPGPFDPREIFPLVRKAVVEQEEPDKVFLDSLHMRRLELQKREYLVSKSIGEFERSWRGKAFHSYLLRNAAFGIADSHSIVELLASRKELNTTDRAGIQRLRESHWAAGRSIAACITGDKSEYLQILSTDSLFSKSVLFACGRLMRAEFPLPAIVKFLNHDNHLLSIAASRYLESEDSIEARGYLYRSAPDQAWILGSRHYFGRFQEEFVGEQALRKLFISAGIPAAAIHFKYFERDWDELDFVETKIKQRIAADPALLGIYWFQQNVVLVYDDRFEYLYADDPARYQTRVLKPAEYQNFTKLLTTYSAGNLPAMLGKCDECEDKQLIMASRAGGRRILFSGDRPSPFESGLANLFADFRRSAAKVQYWAKEKVPEIGIVHASERVEIVKFYRQRNQIIAMVKDSSLDLQITQDIERLNSDDLDNPLVSAEEADYRKIERAKKMPLEAISWFELSETGFGSRVEAPDKFVIEENSEIEFLRDLQAPSDTVRQNGVELKATKDGFFRIANGRTETIFKGHFAMPAISADGAIALVMSLDKRGNTLLKIHFRDNKTSEIRPPAGYRMIMPDKYYPGIGKFLLRATNTKNIQKVELQDADGFLYDPAHGSMDRIDGQRLDLLEQANKGMQETLDSRQWAAIEKSQGTSIGKFDQLTFRFEEVKFVPWIRFESHQLFVNSNETAALIVYNGQLIRIPLANKNID